MAGRRSTDPARSTLLRAHVARTQRSLVGLAGVATVLVCAKLVEISRPGASLARPVASPATATFVGAQTCSGCHPAEMQAWRGSHHDLAMRVAADSTVAGDFANARVTYAGVTTIFTRRGADIVAHTDGPDGVVRDYRIAYTIGIAPLQQYLIELPGGRIQALGIAWDTRPRARGGQRWFHLYPGQHVTHSDDLHWTGIRQNWNYMCAECHSTDVKKNYDPARREFATTFAAVNVACEACHGPGSAHVRSRGQVAFAPLTRGNQVERCARCHARGEQLTDDYHYGKPLGDTHRVSLLDEPLYYPDGQIHDEVFEYGSFLQSRMYAKGVVCSDCHDPHSGRVRAQGNALCLRCHSAERYDTPAHHFHRADSPGASCTACHMPTTTYMIVHPRHDHSLRVPRPDLSVALGVPNACNKCHDTRTASWAAARVRSWYGRPAGGFQHYAEALAAAARGDTAAPRLLDALIRDRDQPPIARATAIARLAGHLDGSPDRAFDDVRAALDDASPLVRSSAVDALAGIDGAARAQLLSPLLSDSVRTVRLDAIRALADVPRIDAGEYVATERFNADRPESHLNLGLLYASRGALADAESELREALAIDGRFVPALVNLADIYREMNRDPDAERTLRRALTIDPSSAQAHHALGLVLVREHRLGEALPELERAMRIAPWEPRFAEVYALARKAARGRSR